SQRGARAARREGEVAGLRPRADCVSRLEPRSHSRVDGANGRTDCRPAEAARRRTREAGGDARGDGIADGAVLRREPNRASPELPDDPRGEDLNHNYIPPRNRTFGASDSACGSSSATSFPRCIARIGDVSSPKPSGSFKSAPATTPREISRPRETS